MTEKSKSSQSAAEEAGDIREKRKNEILGILLTALGLFSGIAIFTSSTGLIGQMLVDIYTLIIGSGCYLIPVLLSIWGIALIRLKTVKFNSRIAGFLLAYISIFAIFHTYVYNSYPLASAMQGRGGGYLAGGLSWVLLELFGTPGAYVVLSSFLLIGSLLWFDILLHPSLEKIINLFKKLIQKLNQKKLVVEEYIPEGVVTIEEGSNGEKDLLTDDYYFENEEEYNEEEYNEEEYNGEEYNKGEFKDKYVDGNEDNKKEEDKSTKNNQQDGKKNQDNTNYKLPGITILKRSGRKKVKLENKSNLLEETLESFGVEASVIDVSHGPSITRYEVQPASGVKVSKIVNLADDIALSLAASDVRIEAPIPGKAAVGIEVPHQGNIFVRIRDVLSSKEFKNAEGKLTLALGKGIDGRPIVADLSSMPHLLVAGATGSGKSVCINTFITSILYKAAPDEVKFILVDPKKVELSNYKGLPHLFTPVVVDPKKASSVLKLVVKEMEERYELFSESGTRGINSYNKKVTEEEQLPYIVVIIDELSDLMMVAASEVEDSICRLAQMSRAAGIHLVIATQRPSVDVITGLIKANIPSRISFAVSSQTDSRTILDMGGAEKLLGQGDMLYAPVGEQKPIRIQGAFISNEEINDLVYYTKNQTDAEFEVELDEIKEVQISTDDDQDELYEEAVKLVVKYRASISMLQRRLHIGHSRAARMIDTMEEEGIVGPYVGSKPREVLISEEELESHLQEDEIAETAAAAGEDNDNNNNDDKNKSKEG